MDSGVFRARSVREALKLVRTEIGDEAMIVSQRRVDGWVEVTARRDDGRVGVGAQRAARSAPQQITGDRSRERLIGYGFDGDFVDAVFSAAASLRWSDVERSVKQLLPAAPKPVALSRGRIRVIGPVGAGRTTTLIRLATNHVLQFGNRSVAMVTGDTARLAGAEALMLAGELLGVPVLEASSSDEMTSALGTLADRSLVLVDTPGLSPHGAGVDALGELPGFETFVVLPVTYRIRALQTLIRQCAALQPSGVVLTQLDGADGVGDVLSLLWRNALGVAWLGSGSDLDGGLDAGTAELLWRMSSTESAAAPARQPETPAESPPAPRANRQRRELAIA